MQSVILIDQIQTLETEQRKRIKKIKFEIESNRRSASTGKA